MPTIRRYANRKLYHVEDHRYIKLDDIARIIRAGAAVTVLDHASGQDITTEVLAQVIAQERPAGLDAFLTALIRGGQHPLEEAGKVLSAALGLPTGAQWRRLEGDVGRLEALVDALRRH